MLAKNIFTFFIDNMNNNINFTARYIHPVRVGKTNGFFSRSVDVAFVELTAKDKSVVSSVADTWNASISDAIANNSSKTLKRKNKKSHVFALTSQSKNFKNLNQNKILGLIEYKQGSSFDELCCLQVNPNCINRNLPILQKIRRLLEFYKPFYNGIGTGALESLKSLFGDSKIVVESISTASEFYEKNGFKPIYEDGLRYIWQK